MNARKTARRRIRAVAVWLGAFAVACSAGVPVVRAQEKSSSEKKDGDGKKKAKRKGAKRTARGNPSPSGADKRDELADAIAQARQTEQKGGAKIDPKLQKRIDELLKKAATQGQAKPPTPAPPRRKPRVRHMPQPKRGRAQPPSAARSDPGQPAGAGGASIDIEPAADGVPPESRTYRFSIKNGTYEQLVEGFARQTGLGVIGEAPRDGKVSFVTTEELSFTEALSRIRMLLFNYKQHDPYWLERRESHLAVVRVADFYRVLPVDRMFPSLEKFRASGLPDDELVLVIYTPTSGSVSDLSRARDFMPDYMRVTPLQERNAVTIFGLSKDIEKYMSVIDLFVLGSRRDPRTTVKIKVVNLLPSEALEKLRRLTELDQLPNQPRTRNVPRRNAEPSVLDNVPEPAVVLIPEDLQGYILVRAMQDKIDEIRLLLPIIDVPAPNSDVTPVVIPLKYARADQLVTTLQQVIAATSGPSASGVTPPSSPRRPRRKTAASAGPVRAHSITMLPHPSMNAIVVMAPSEEEERHVRALIALFDVESHKRLRIELSYADPNEVTNTILAVLAGGAKQKPMDLPQLIPDPSGGAIYFTGSETALEDVRSIIAAVDVPSEPVVLHVQALKKRLPSFVANILREYDNAIPQPQSAGAGKQRGTTARGGVRRVRKAMPVASKFTADDGEMRLLVLCTNTEWQKYEPLIQQLEDSVDPRRPFVRLELANIEPDVAVDRLSGLIPQLPGPAGGMRFAASAGAVLVIDASAADLERVKAFLAEIDRPVTVEQRIFEIKHKDPAEIHQAIDALIATPAGSATGPARVRHRVPGAKAVTGPSGALATQSDGMTIVELGNKLVVRATPEVLDKVAALIDQFDVESAASEMRVYGDFPPGTDVISLSETVKTVVSGRGTRARHPGRPGASDADADVPRFVPYPPSNKLIVIAEPSMFADVERVIDLFRSAADAPPIEVSFVKLTYADAAEVIDLVAPLLDIQIRRLVRTGEIADVQGAGSPAISGGKRRVGRTPGGAAGEKYHLAADGQNHRIVIAAPRSIIKLATDLIEQFDSPHEEDEIVFKTIRLNNAEPALMVKAVKEMVGTSVRHNRARKTAQGVPATADAAMPLTITEAPAGGAVVLRGTKADVEDAVMWIHDLDSMSSAGQLVRVFEVKTADIKNLVELILHMVEPQQPRGRNQPRMPVPRRRSAAGSPGALEEPDADVWETSKTWTGQDLFIQADLIDKTMLVATTESKMARIESLIQQIDEDPAIQGPLSASDQQIPNFAYELRYADPIDAVWDADAVFDELFRSDQRPKVRSAFFGDNTIIVEYPDEDRFDELRHLIATYVDKLPARDLESKTVSGTPPDGMNAEETALWFKMNHPEVQIELIDISEEPVEYDIEEIAPLRSDDRRSSAVLPPGPLGRLMGYAVATILAQQDAQTQPDPDEAKDGADLEPVDELTPRDAASADQDEMIRRMIRTQLQQQTGAAPKQSGETPEASKHEHKHSDGVRLPADQQKLQILYDKNKGVFVVKGPKVLVDDVKNWMDDLEEEIKDFPAKPDIRIYRVRYIDVFTAQDIIEEMFNATKQQRNMVQQQQRMLQQQRVRQQQQQARQRQQQQQQQQQAGKGQPPGQPGRPGQQPQQPQVQMPQLPPTSVRVYPNPRDRTLIFRADTSQYPAILELLAKIDQPKPFDAELRIFHLEKLNAADVVETLTKLLGLDGKSGAARRSTPAPVRRGRGVAQAAPSTAPGQHLPRTILQEVATGTGTLGVDPEDITLSSNEEANSIVVMAPPAALDFVGELIKKLENEDVPTRETRYFELIHAPVDEVLEYLTNHYAKAGRRTRSRSGARRSSKGVNSSAASTGEDLTSPTFIAYPRLNMLTVQAPAAMLDEVADLIAKLDGSSTQDQWSDIVLEHADAKAVADTLAQMFGESGGKTKAGRGGGRGSGGAARGAKFIGEEGGRIVLYRAPEMLASQITEAVAKLEESAKQTSSIRVLTLEHATPSRVAEAIESAYGSSRGGGSRRGSAPKVQFSVTAHDPSRQLFIRSDQALFDEIESLVKTLDVPGGLGFDFRIYPLKYANARDVHATMTQLVQGYMKQLGAAAKDMAPFSVEVNEAANALVVLGGPQVFGFLEENLRKIDTPAAAEQREVHVVTLLTADANAVAKTLTDIFVTGASGKGRAGAGGGSPAISISAVQGAPSILVKCSKDKFAEIESVIQQLDSEDAAAGEVRVVSLLYSDASEMNKALQETLRKPGGGGGRGGKELVGGVRVSALAQTNALVISGGKEQVENLEATVKQLDAAGEKGSVPQIIKLEHAKVAHVLSTLQEMIGKDKRGRGGQSAPIIAANEPLNALVVRASQTDMAWIEGMIAKIDTPDYPSVPGIRVVQLQSGINLNDLAEKVEMSVNKVAESNQTAGGGKGKPSSISVTPDSRTNSLIIAGAPALFGQAEELARTMEKMGPSGGRETRIISVKNVDIDEIRRLVEQLTGQSAQSGGSGARRKGSAGGAPRPRRPNSGRRPRKR